MLSLNQVWGPRPIRPPWGTPRGLRPDAPRLHARPAPSSQGGPACHGDAPQLRPLLRLSPSKARARSAPWGRPRPRPNATRAGAFHRHAKQIFCIIWGTAEALAPKDKPYGYKIYVLRRSTSSRPQPGRIWAGAGGCLASPPSGLPHPTSFSFASLACSASALRRLLRSLRVRGPGLAALPHSRQRPRPGWGSARCGSQGPGLLACFMVIWQAHKPGP